MDRRQEIRRVLSSLSTRIRFVGKPSRRVFSGRGAVIDPHRELCLDILKQVGLFRKLGDSKNAVKKDDTSSDYVDGQLQESYFYEERFPNGVAVDVEFHVLPDEGNYAEIYVMDGDTFAVYGKLELEDIEDIAPVEVDRIREYVNVAIRSQPEVGGRGVANSSAKSRRSPSRRVASGRFSEMPSARLSRRIASSYGDLSESDFNELMDGWRDQGVDVDGWLEDFWIAVSEYDADYESEHPVPYYDIVLELMEFGEADPDEAANYYLAWVYDHEASERARARRSSLGSRRSLRSRGLRSRELRSRYSRRGLR